MLVKLCLGSLEEKVVRALSFFRRPCCLVQIVLWVAVSDCCIYVLNDIGNDPFCRSNMNSDTCNLYKSDIFNMLSVVSKQYTNSELPTWCHYVYKSLKSPLPNTTHV